MSHRRFDLNTWLALLSALAIMAGLVLVFLVAPREAVMGDVQRVFYFHVGAAWTGYLALLVSFVASLLYLWQHGRRWDMLALSSTEIGLVFITQGIVSGSFWAKATWGVWWTWEPRLTTSAVLWVIYASYLTLRGAMEDQERRSRIAAVYGVLGFVAVPINFMAIRWWRSVHPVVFASSGGGLARGMLPILIACVVAYTVLFLALLVFRFRQQRLAEQIQILKRS